MPKAARGPLQQDPSLDCAEIGAAYNGPFMSALTRHLRRFGFLWFLLIVYLGYQGWPQWAMWLGVLPNGGRPAPAFRVTDLNGQVIDSRELTGKVVLVNFWATWCPPCRVEMPDFDEVYRRHRDDGFLVVALALDGENRHLMEQVVAELELSFPVIAGAGRLPREFGAGDVVPTSFLIDRQGRIRSQVRGIFRPTVLRSAVQELLQEPVQATTRGDRAALIEQ